MWFAVVTLTAELAVQIYAWRHATQAMQAVPSEKTTLLASAVSLGLNAAAIESVVLLAILGALGLLALTRRGGP